jgi:hypothetical protein
MKLETSNRSLFVHKFHKDWAELEAGNGSDRPATGAWYMVHVMLSFKHDVKRGICLPT